MPSSRRQTPDAAPESSPPAWRRGITFAVVLVVLAAGILLWRAKRDTPSEDALATTAPKTSPATGSGTARHAPRPFPSGKQVVPAEDDPAELANKRLGRARHTLE